MEIGGIKIKGHVVLGPMAGVTTLAYREFMKPFGVGLSYSEMISDCGIDYRNKRTMDYFATSSDDRPVGLQLFGFSKENSVPAIKFLEENASYDILDINLGCPVYKVVKTGAGSAWLKRPEELYEYMRAVCTASKKPVTAKIRLGWDSSSINVMEIAPMLEKAGVKAVTVHARTSVQGYTGKADYSKIASLKDKLCIPLIVSGDIFSPEDAKKAIEITKADAVMLARGGLGHPFLVNQINQYLDTGSFEPDPSPSQQADYALDFSTRLVALKGESRAIKELRGLVPHFFSSFPGFKKIRTEIAVNISTMNDLRLLLEGIKKRQGC